MIVACLAACQPPPDDPVPYRLVLDEHELMAHVLDPAADVIWSSAGAVITAQGETDLAPTTDEGWLAVENAAATLMEAGNLLMLPGRAADDGAWREYSRALSRTAERALAAADARDADALFDIGGELYNVCLACHQAYDDMAGDASTNP